MAELGLLPERGGAPVVFLIAGLGALPAYHGVALGAEVGGGALGEVEAGLLAHHPNASRVGVARDAVAERHVVVAQVPFDVEQASLGSLEVGHVPHGVVAHMRGLDAVEPVVDLHGLALLSRVDEPRVVAVLRHESERRGGEHGLPVIFDAVEDAGVGRLFEPDAELPVWAAEHRECGREQH